MKTFILILFAAASLCGQTLINGSRVLQGTQNYCADAGASDAYACNLSPAITAYVEGACYVFTANTANTGAASIALNSLAAKTIKKAAGGVTTDLADNDIRADQVVNICYDGVNMQMQSLLGNAGGGGGGGTIDATVAPWWPWFASTGGGAEVAAGSANQGVCHRFTVPGVGLTSSGVGFNVSTGSGTGCSGGVCGYGFGIYTNGGTGVAYSEIGTSDHGTASKNINTPTGIKKLVWSSGSAVSGGTMTLTAGNYYMCSSSDSTVLEIVTLGAAQWQVIEVGLISDSHGWQSSFSTGNGASLTLAASKSGSFTHTGNGATTPLFVLN